MCRPQFLLVTAHGMCLWPNFVLHSINRLTKCFARLVHFPINSLGACFDGLSDTDAGMLSMP